MQDSTEVLSVDMWDAHLGNILTSLYSILPRDTMASRKRYWNQQ